MSNQSQIVFLQLLEDLDFPIPVTEYVFHDKRKWRMDYAWPDLKICLEVEGGIYVGGRHSGGIGMQNDFDKYNEAAIDGWRIIKVVPKNLCSRATILMLRRILIFGNYILIPPNH